MASVAQQTIKFNVDALLDEALIEQICQEKNYHWREGKLTPVETLQNFAWQIVMGNQTLDAVKHHSHGSFTASAYCQARQRLPLEVMQKLSQRIAQGALQRGGGSKDHRWRGHRVFRIDGTSTSLADAKEVRDYFGCSGKQKRGCGYPTAHLLLLTGPGAVALEAICSPLRTGDMTHASKTHAHLQAGDILLGDGLFGGWGHLQQLQSQQLHGVFPRHHSRKLAWGKSGHYGPNCRFVKKLGYRDQLVEYKKPTERPAWMETQTFKQASPWLLVRQTQRCIKIGGVRRKIVVVSTLTDSVKYPAQEMVKLLAERWFIETQIRCIKTTMGMETLRCQTVEGVHKELLMYLMVYNLLRLFMLQAAERQGVCFARLSFADALAALRWGDGRLQVDVEIVPRRAGRIEPRVVKRRRKPFMMMNQPRQRLRRELILRQKRKAA